MLEHSLKSNLHNGFHMETTAILSDNGRLDGKPTHIWSTNDLFGFTGAVIVYLVDAQGGIVNRSRAHTGGVDGKRVGDPSKDLFWSEDFSQDEVKRTVKLEIMHVKAPHGRIEENLDEAVRIAEKISKLVEHVGDIIGEVIDMG